MTREYLSKAFRLENFINAKLEQKQRTFEMATKATSTLSLASVGGSTEQSKVENYVVKFVDLENEINKAIDELVEIKLNISRAIGKVKDDNLRLVLELRYSNFMKWEQISVDMNYGCKQVKRLHKKALSELEKMSPNVL